MKIFSTDFRRALCVLLLAPLGWLAGWHSVSAAAPDWRVVDNNIVVFMADDVNRVSMLNALCCTSNVGGNCAQFGDTGSSPGASNIVVPFNRFHAICAYPTNRPYLLTYWSDNGASPGYTYKSGAQTWPATSPKYQKGTWPLTDNGFLVGVLGACMTLVFVTVFKVLTRPKERRK